MAKLPKTLFALGWGASTGFTLDVMKIGDENGPKRLAAWANPFFQAEGGIFWDIDQLDDIIAEVLKTVPPDALIYPYGWGADWMAVNMGGGVVGRPLHYATFFQSAECSYFDKILNKLPKEQIFEMTSGAPVDRYQPYTHIAWILAHHPGWLLSDETSRLMAVSDYVTKRLSGGYDGQDQAMRQSQGLWSAAAVQVYLDLFGLYGPKIADLIEPWNPFGLDEVIEVGGRVIIPATHDSGLSRLWGSLFGDLLVWTGSWTGVSVHDTFPSNLETLQRLDKAGFSREGAGRLGFINANVHLWGKIWRALKEIIGVEYGELADMARKSERQARRIDAVFAEAYLADPQTGAKVILGSCGGDVGFAARRIMRSSVSAITLEARKLTALVGAKYKSAVITGGFAENSFHTELLERHFRVVVPPFAGMASTMGAFVEAICRIEQVPPKEAAKILLPDLPIKQ